jgi:tetratricopeptide (TPR) repeat protein
MKPRWEENETEYMPEMDVQDAVYEDSADSPKKVNKLFIFIALGLLIAAAAYLLSDIMSSGSLGVGDAPNSGNYLDGLKERVFGGNGGEAYWQRTASAFVQRGDYESAVQCYDKLTEINASSSEAWKERGYSLLKLGSVEAAAISLNRSTSINPADSDAWKAEGDSLASLGKNEEALKCYDKALVLSPRSFAILYSMGKAMNNVGRYDDAARCFEKAIESDAVPSGEAWKGKGDSMMGLENYDEALRCYDNAVMLNSTDGDAIYKKSLVLHALGRESEANDALTAAEKIKGEDLNFSKEEKITASAHNPPALNTANPSQGEVKGSPIAESKATDSAVTSGISISSSSNHNSHQKKSSSSSGAGSSSGSGSGSAQIESKGTSQASEKSQTESSLSSHSSMVYSTVSYSEISGAA